MLVCVFKCCIIISASQPPALKIMNNFLSPSKTEELSEHDTSFYDKKKKREAGRTVSLCADGCARLAAQSAYLIGSFRLVAALFSLRWGRRGAMLG